MIGTQTSKNGEAFYIQDGRIFDRSGQEYDKDYKPFLRRSPEMEAKFKAHREQMKADAIARSRVQVMRKEERQKDEDIASMRERINSLKDANHHAGCRKLFYHDCIHNEEWVAQVLLDCDEQIKNALRLRNKILDAQVVGELKIDEADEQISKNSDEIDALYTRIEEIELARRMAKAPVEKKDTSANKADAVIRALKPEVRERMEKDGTLAQLRAALMAQK